MQFSSTLGRTTSSGVDGVTRPCQWSGDGEDVVARARVVPREVPGRELLTVPSDGVYGAYYCQAVSATAPHPFAARLWQEFLYSDQGQILWLKGFGHPARFTDLAGRKVIPKPLLQALPSAAIYNKVRFASLGQQAVAAAKIKAEWASKVG